MSNIREVFSKTGMVALLILISSMAAKANDSDIVNCNKSWKIVVLGSSTAYGTGATVYDSSWVGLFISYIKRRNALNTVVNLGIPGYTTYQNLRPTGYIPPTGRPSPNSGFNITAALAEHPNAIIINMPSNDAANNYTITEQQANFEAAVRLADSANVPVWVTTTQPRNLLTSAQMSSLTTMRDWINTRFGKKAVDFWTTVSNPDGTIATAYMYDNVHVNNSGHRLFFSRMAAETILDSLCNRSTASCSIGTISGPTNACAYTGNSGLTATYSIAVSGATDINWIVPEDADLISGQGTNTITLKYLSTFLSGSISAVVTTSCGSTETRTLAITQRSPVFSSGIIGPLNVCQYTGTNLVATYSVTPASGAIAYRWTLPTYMSLVSATTDSSSINVLIASGFTTSTNKKIRVQAISGCGSSIVLSLTLNTTVPSTATSISGPTGVCANSGTTTPAVFKINKLTGANSYNWTVPIGSSVSHPAGTGTNDTIINVIFSNTFTSGSIAVAGVSGCGSGAFKTLAVAKSVPLIPDSIITTSITTTCPNRRYSYSIPTLPAYASSVKWTVPANAVIDSGQNTTKIFVTYNSSSVTNQLVRAAGVNGCGQGTRRDLTVNLPLCTLISGNGEIFSRNIAINNNTENSGLQVINKTQDKKILFSLMSDDHQSPVNIRIYDIEGRLIEKLSDCRIGSNISTTNNLTTGFYFIVANQGKYQKSAKIFIN